MPRNAKKCQGFCREFLNLFRRIDGLIDLLLAHGSRLMPHGQKKGVGPVPEALSRTGNLNLTPKSRDPFLILSRVPNNIKTKNKNENGTNTFKRFLC